MQVPSKMYTRRMNRRKGNDEDSNNCNNVKKKIRETLRNIFYCVQNSSVDRYFRKAREKNFTWKSHDDWTYTHVHNTHVHNTSHTTRYKNNLRAQSLLNQLLKTMFPTWDMFAYLPSIRSRVERKRKKEICILDDLGRDTKENFYYWDTTNTWNTLVLRTHSFVPIVSHAWTIRIAILYLMKWTLINSSTLFVTYLIVTRLSLYIL